MSKHVSMGWAVVAAEANFPALWCRDKDHAEIVAKHMNEIRYSSVKWVVEPAALHGEIVWDRGKWPT